MTSRWKLPKHLHGWFCFLLPLAYYWSLTPLRFPRGDGSELMAAAHQLGVPHPSGYPLWTMLAYVTTHLPFLSPNWWTSALLSGLPGALTSFFIFDVLRRLKVNIWAAMSAAMIWVLNYHVLYQSTRAEVYSLHCLFVAASIWGVLRFAQEKRLRWAYFAVASVCLGLANHLTASMLILPVVISLLLSDHRQLLKPRPILISSGIALLGASIYLYLPWAASRDPIDAVIWNDPQTLSRFWFHVTGSEYSSFRNGDSIMKNLNNFRAAIGKGFFPGAILVSILGAWEWGSREHRSLIAVLLFFASNLAYVSTYTINDISTYYSGMFVVLAMMLGLGVEWLLTMRGSTNPKWKKAQVVVAIIGVLLIFGNKAWNQRFMVYKEALSEDMSDQVMAAIAADGEPSIIFTAVDHHSFPMWFQTFVKTPKSNLLALDQTMFGAKGKEWYRDHFRRHYPQYKWPSEDRIKGRWRRWLMINNPDLTFYALLGKRWIEPGTYSRILGWHAKITLKKPKGGINKYARHIFTSRAWKKGKRIYLHDSRVKYLSGEAPIACVAEWNKPPLLMGHWSFTGPDGKTINIKPHKIPAETSGSWEFLTMEQQKPGDWTCKVTVKGEAPLMTKFTLE